MKNTLILILTILSFTSLSNFTKAQSEAAIPSLYLSPSAQSTGLGWTGVSIPNEDAFGFYYNPAMLGYFSQTKNLAVQFLPSKIDWLGYNFITINSFALSLGYNFKKELHGLNLSAGFGIIKNKFTLGSSFQNTTDSYNTFGLGFSLDYFVNLSIGLSYKKIDSKLKFFSGEQPRYEANASAIDYGFLLTIPVIKLIDKNLEWKLSDRAYLKPIFNYSLGYSRSNIGDEIYYVDPAQSDPLPLTARLGHTLTFGLNLKSNKTVFKLLTYNLILEADDILIERPSFDSTNISSNNFSYQGMLGDIKFGKNLIELKPDDKVVVHKGHKINLGETVTFLIGSFAGRGYGRNVKTNGLIISTKGITKLFSNITKSPALIFLSKHFELQYVSSTIFKDESLETDFSGIQISFGNFYF